MREIPNDIIDDVNKIVDELIKYNNAKKLSWIQTYKYILAQLNMEDRKDDCRLLSNVITKITRLGYDIIDTPFKLNKYI